MIVKLPHPLIAAANHSLDKTSLPVSEIGPSAEELCKHLKVAWNINAMVTMSMPWLIIPGRMELATGRTRVILWFQWLIECRPLRAASLAEVVKYEFVIKTPYSASKFETAPMNFCISGAPTGPCQRFA